jgi:D-3-phosphoglycerate dehydrogenase
MALRVLITEKIDRSGTDYLLKRGYDVVLGTGISEETVMKEIAGCDAILTRNARISERIMQSSAKLKVIAMHGVGVDNIDVEAATRRGIQVTNAAGSNSISVAEFTIGLLIALSRNLLRYDRELRKRNWNIRSLLGADLEGRTLGIIGMGNIGGLVAKKAALGLGMKVLGYRRHAGPSPGYAEITTDLKKVLSRSDFISIHVPSSPSTRKMISANEIAVMKTGAYLLNTARGNVVDHDALVTALREKKLAGAAIDVFDGEIPARDDPLLSMQNVIVTPHAAALTYDSVSKMSLYSAMGIDEVLSGQTPTFPVNNVLKNQSRRIC